MRPLQTGTSRSTALVLIAGLLFLESCSYTIIPKAVPAIRESEGEAQFKGLSVLVVNAEKDNNESPILTETKGSSAFNATKRAWCQKLVESLARELARRGADVRINAPITIGVALPDIIFTETGELFRFRTKAALLSAGWTKEYQGTASIETSKVFSPEREAEKLGGQALADTVNNIIHDAEFRAHLRTDSVDRAGR